MEVRLDLTQVALAVIALLGTGGGASALLAAGERQEIRNTANEAVEKAEQAHVTCLDLDNFSNGLVEVLNLSLDEAPASGPMREGQEQFVRRATTLINGLGCGR